MESEPVDVGLVRSPFLSLPGAVEGSGIDAGIAAHYGNPLPEQRALVEGRAIVDLSHRAVLSVAGADRLTWIDSITSQAVRGMQPGDCAETLILDQAGRIEYAIKLVDDGDTLWMLTEMHEAPGLLAWLLKMRFMLRVEPADRTSEFAVVGSFAPITSPDVTVSSTSPPAAAAGIAASHNGPGHQQTLPAAHPHDVPLVWRDPWASVSEGGWQYAAADGHPAADWNFIETIVARSALAEIANGSTPAGFLAVEALRVAAWRPRLATEGDERSIPHELDWLRSAVHLSKGCYRGQETVAKVHNLGHPPRRLVMLHLDGSDAVHPVRGDEVRLGEVAVGKVTSSALHYELGPIALAVVKRSIDPAATLTVFSGGVAVAAAQEVVVPPDAGATAGVPRLPRLGSVQR